VSIVLTIFLVMSSIWLAILVAYRHELHSAWVEPVLRHPILILESDDWGPGPERHAVQLERLAELLQSHSDSRGRHPVMTLGLVLAVPDATRISAAGLEQYHRLTLGDARFRCIRDAIERGRAAGVFALQLHGMEHFWPPVLMRLAPARPELGRWLTEGELPDSEDLPSHLQSRWTDAEKLPSTDLPAAEIEAAAAEEVAAFAKIFGMAPVVAVPPTFVWTRAVEEAWVRAGVKAIVTPGRRYSRRDAAGRPAGSGSPIYNGEQALGQATYLVRDDYFEPSRGHTAGQALNALKRKFRLGRPILYETHRFNFTNDQGTAGTAMQEVDELLRRALVDMPGLRFVSTEALAEEYRKPRSLLFDWRWQARLNIWLRRLNEVSRLRKLAWLSGLAVLAGLLLVATRPVGAERAQAARPGCG